MYRGTTPTITMNLSGVLVSEISYGVMTVKADGVEIEKDTDGGLSFDSETNAAIANLTQQETLQFTAGSARVQLRARLNSGKVVATNIILLDVADILKDGEI